MMRINYAWTMFADGSTTLNDVREAVETTKEIERIARRVLGGAHPLVQTIVSHVRDAQAALRYREATQTPPPS